MVEAGRRVGVADGMVQAGGGLGRQSVPNHRADHLGQGLRAGEKVGSYAAAAHLGRPTELGQLPQGPIPLLSRSVGHLDEDRQAGRQRAERPTGLGQIDLRASRSRRPASRNRGSAASSWFSSSTWSDRGSRITDKPHLVVRTEMALQLRQPGRRADETVAQHRVGCSGRAAIAVQRLGHSQLRGREQPGVVDQIRHQHGGRIGHQRRLSQSPKRSTGSVAVAQSSASSAVRRLLRRDAKTNPPATAPRTTSAFHFTAPP